MNLLQPLPPMPAILVDNTCRDHLVGNLYFVPFFVFYTESVTLGPRFIPESVFYTQSVMLSPRFIPSP